MIPRCRLKYKLYLRELGMCARVHHALHLSWVHCLCLTVATLRPHKVSGDEGKTPVSMSERSTMESSQLRAPIQGPHSLILQYRNCSCFPLSPLSSSDRLIKSSRSEKNPRALCAQCRQRTFSVALLALLDSYTYLYNETWSLWPPFPSYPPFLVQVQSSNYKPVTFPSNPSHCSLFRGVKEEKPEVG